MLGLYTGCRLEQLGQLRVSDVQEKDGIPYLSITDDAEDEEAKGLKTQYSRRKMPVHPELVKGGFLDYIKQLIGEGKRRLTPKLKADRTDKITGNWPKWWGRYRRTVDGVSSLSKAFRAFRHTFRGACREAEIHEELAVAAEALDLAIGESTSMIHRWIHSISRIPVPWSSEAVR